MESYFTALAASSGPALIWYAPGGERVELTGRVVENWTAKSANLLAEELDAEPGSALRLAAAPHWRSVVLALGALRAGCRLVTGGGEAPDLWAGFEPGPGMEEAGTALLMARGALAMSYDGAAELPAGTLDFAREVRGQGDVFLPFEPVPPESPAAQDGDDVVTQSEWLERVGEHAGAAASREGGLALAVGDEELGAEELARCAGVMRAGRSVVLIHPEVAGDRPALERILAEERASL
ncbi:TIGR03089 family protein [Rothia halotolerans]|uniref:TIGR03089 family protein n=1 Tax=Rothia halotolerans TaxID=405770 RepID=UPI00101D2A12|nr:TIGR03089 family protein [Rothia halotolerans]